MTDRERWEQAIAEGGSVLIGGRSITRVEDLPPGDGTTAPAPSPAPQGLESATDEALIQALSARGYTVTREAPTGGPATGDPPATAAYKAGDRVLYTTSGGNAHEKVVVALNADGTYELEGGPKAARADQLKPLT